MVSGCFGEDEVEKVTVAESLILKVMIVTVTCISVPRNLKGVSEGCMPDKTMPIKTGKYVQ